MKKGWEIKNLGDVFSLEYGKPLDKSKRKPNGLYPVYGANGVIDRSDDFFIDGKSIIVGRKGSAGEINYTEDKFWPLDVSYYTKFDKKVLNIDFLFYLLSQLELPKLAKGVKPGINRNDVYAIKSAIPPLSEQQHIVFTLDKCFSSIDQAKANIERNFNNAKEIFQSELNSIFSNKGDDWIEKKLGEVLQKTETIDPTKNPEKEFIYIDISSVNKETLSIEETNLIKGKNAPSRARKLIKTNDVIFATVRPTLKRIAIITEEYDEQVCSTGYFVLRAVDTLNNKLVFYYLLTNYFQDMMEKLQKGASYPAVTDNEVRQQLISFPKDLKTQQKIVFRLGVLSSETKRLETLYQQKLTELEELKKSILQKAFSGELKTIQTAISI